MNLPNKLTIFRIILIPVCLIFILFNLIPLDIQIRRYITTFLFIIACITDALDGYIARKYNLITNFGKLMDPLADKILVISLMISLLTLKDSIVPLSPLVVIIIIGRELFITGFRTVAIEKGIVISADKYGKIKTISQMLMVIVLLLNINNPIFTFISYFLIYLSVFFTIYSMIEYILKNKEVFRD